MSNCELHDVNLDSQFAIPVSIPDSQFPIRNSQFDIRNSRVTNLYTVSVDWDILPEPK